MYKKLRYGLLTLLAFVGLTANAQTTFDFDEDYATLFPDLVFDSEGKGYISDGDAVSIEKDGFTVTVSVGDNSEKNANCIWNNSPRLRIYSGTITISGSGIETIKFVHGGNFTLSTSTGDLTGNIWTGNANKVVFACGENSTQLKQIIINDEIIPIEPVEVSIAQFLDKEDSEDVWYQLTGTVKNLTNTSKGYFDLEDASGNSVYVYGLASERGGGLGKFSELNIAVGDILTIVGNRYTFINSNGESKNEVTNAYFVSVEKSTVIPKTEDDLNHGSADDPISVAEGIEAAEVIGSKNSTNYFYVAGVISQIEEEYGAQYGNATFYITDKGSDKEMKVYRAKFFDNNKWATGQQQIAVGDAVVLCGKIVNFQGKSPQIASGYLVSLNYTAPSDPETYEVNVTEALDVIDALADNQTAYDYYQVTGYVVEAPNYDNGYEGKFTGTVDLYLADTKDGEAKLFVYHGLGLNNEKFTGEDDLDLFVAGDQVTFLGKLQKYIDKDNNTKLELKDCYLVKASASLEMPARGLATFCSPYPIEIEDQNVYIVTQVGKDKALVQKVDAGIIESGTGLLVEGSGTVNIAYAYGEKGNALSGNMLVGTLKEKDLAKGEAYILKDGAFHLSDAGTFPARKAYLPVDAASGAKLFIDFSGMTTAISEVKTQNESSEIYTIGGVRVKNAQQKGVYIINGKKVVK